MVPNLGAHRNAQPEDVDGCRPGYAGRPMSLRPEEITTAGLPRRAVRGFDPRATDELLKRVAWDYRKLFEEARELSLDRDRLRGRVDELEARLAELESQAQDRQDAEEVGRALIAEAERTAHEIRESARSESDAAVREAQERARLVEAEAQRRLDAATEAQRVAAQVRGRIRAALDAVLAEDGVQPSP
jgi:cell division septum initiation protein DivIVA